MQFPLELKFRLLTWAAEATVTDATGRVALYVKQKAFRLKEDIRIFADIAQTVPLYTIQADRVLDFNAVYRFLDASAMPIGQIRREGVKSLWSASYQIQDAFGQTFTITEANPWIKVGDALLSEVPILGWLTGYFLNPSYQVKRPDGAVVMTLVKQPSFAERYFRIEKNADLDEETQRLLLLGLLLFDIIERDRG